MSIGQLKSLVLVCVVVSLLFLFSGLYVNTPHVPIGGLRGCSSLLTGGGHAFHTATSSMATYLGQCLTLGQLHTLAGATGSNG